MEAVEGEAAQHAVIRAEESHSTAHRLSLGLLLVVAGLVRIPFVFLPPVLSDDVYRHRWDGRVAAAGIDPYRYAPAGLARSPLADRELVKINHPGIPSVYGPLAQGLLALLAISPAKAAIWSIKATAAVFDVVSVAALYSLGSSLGVGSLAALVWALHPLAVVEAAQEGHLDGVAVSLLLCACALLARGRGRSGAALFACAALVKLTPAFAAPAFLRSAGRKGSLLAIGLFAFAHLPFAASRGEFRGLATYARSWDGNGAVYPDLVRLLKTTDAVPRAKALYTRTKEAFGSPVLFDRLWRLFAPEYAARGLLLAAFVGIAAVVLVKEREPVRASGLLLVALLALSPTLHPWYLLNVLPFALLFRWWSVVWVAGAAPLVYLVTLPLGAPVFPHPDVVRALEFLPALALFFLLDRRRRLP